MAPIATKALWVDRVTPGGSAYRTKIRVPEDADEDQARADFLAREGGAPVSVITSPTVAPVDPAPPVQTGETDTPVVEDTPVEDATITSGGDDIATPGPSGPAAGTSRKRSAK